MTDEPFLPDEALAQHTAVVGTTGSGKTYTAKGIVEHLLSNGRRVCIIDPTGAWWGLRSSADGKAPGFPIAIFGGLHADVPLAKDSGAVLAEIIAKENLPAVIDVSEMLIGEQRRFVEQFLSHLYRENHDPLHLVIDEADEFAPQNPMPETKRVLHQVDRVIRRGRIRGFRAILISQRPAVLHKNVLTQIGTLIAMRLVAPQDRKALQEWIRSSADEVVGKAILASLPKLQQGVGWVWSPQHDILREVAFPKIATFDSSRTPEDGEDVVEPTALSEIDLSKIREQFEGAIEEAAANDPAALRRRIAELEKALRKKEPAAPDTAALETAYLRGWQEGQAKAVDALQAAQRQAVDALSGPSEPPQPAPRPAPAIPKAPATLPATDMAPRHQKILDAIAWFAAVGISPPARSQVAFKVGQSPKSGAFNNNLGALRSAGLIDYPSPGFVDLTAEGAARARPPAVMGTSEDLQDEVFAMLRPGLVRILRHLISVYPNHLSKTDLAFAVEQSATSGSFNNSLGRLRSLGLITYPSPGWTQAADLLFIE